MRKVESYKTYCSASRVVAVYVESQPRNACIWTFFCTPLPVWSCRPSIAWLVDLGIQCFQGWTVVLVALGRVRALGTQGEMVVVTVRIHAAAIHRRV